MTFRQRLYIRHLVDDLGWDPAHFGNFLRKYYHTDSIDKMSKREAGKLIESLKHIITRKIERN
ncbi:MAG: hypothetical protein ABR523_08840 [Desulfurivibrionaceae bacterium]